jgi:hypothetical protein
VFRTDLFELLVAEEVHQLLHVSSIASAVFLKSSALKPKLEIRSAQIVNLLIFSRCKQERRAATKKLRRTF